MKVSTDIDYSEKKRLKKLKKKMKKERRCVPYEMLMEYSMETCELCQSIFHTKLDRYMHNAEHIIIPVRRDYCCLKCNALFASKNIFIHHNCSKTKSKNATETSQDSVDIDCTTLDEIEKEELVINRTLLKAALMQRDEIEKEELSINSTLIKAALLKDLVVKEPIVKCDNFLTNAIIHKNIEMNVTPVKNTPNKPLLKDFVFKELVVKCNNDSIVDKIVSTKACNSNITTLSKINLEPVIRETNMFGKLPYCLDDIVISDSDSNSSTDIKLRDYSKRIDSKLVTITKLEKDNGDCKKEYEPGINFEENDDSINSVNEADAAIEFHDDFNFKNERDNGLKDFIKSEMDAKDFQMLFKSDTAFSESLNTQIIFEDDPDDYLNNDLISFNNLVANKPETEEMAESVHYSDLKYKERVNCKYCRKVFPNMYNLIIHETNHLVIKKHIGGILCPLCSLYIAGNYKTLTKHILREHPLKYVQKQLKVRCFECNLYYYRYDHHARHYHRKRICYICTEQFFDLSLFIHHVCGEKKEVTKSVEVHPKTYQSTQYEKLCDVCSMFKGRVYKYIYLGTLKDIQKSHKCDHCNKNFYEVKKYQKCTKQSLTKWEYVSPGSIQKKHEVKPDEKMLRLKNIWRRLKKIKHINSK